MQAALDIKQRHDIGLKFDLAETVRPHMRDPELLEYSDSLHCKLCKHWNLFQRLHSFMPCLKACASYTLYTCDRYEGELKPLFHGSAHAESSYMGLVHITDDTDDSPGSASIRSPLLSCIQKLNNSALQG